MVVAARPVSTDSSASVVDDVQVGLVLKIFLVYQYPILINN